MIVTINHYLVLSCLLFAIGLSGILLNRRNLIVNLFGVELLLLAVNINFVAFSSFLNDLMGQIFTIFVLTLAAAESAIGLAILVVYYRSRQQLGIESATTLNSMPESEYKDLKAAVGDVQ